MPQPVHYIPIATTVVALAFAPVVYRRYRSRGGTHLAWWAAGILLFGVGTFTEGATTLFGWHEAIFRAWYISGALLGGAPLAQGTVYLLFDRQVANRLTVALVSFVAIAAVCVLLSPIDYAGVEPHRLTGSVLVWRWVRLFSPFINTYAFVFLVGGAILSAIRYWRRADSPHRVVGNTLIAVGAILPGVGGMATRLGHTEVLYVTELIGLSLIWLGYRASIRERSPVGRTLAHAPS